MMDLCAHNRVIASIERRRLRGWLFPALFLTLCAGAGLGAVLTEFLRP